MEFNRRATDSDVIGERVVKLETNVEHMHTAIDGISDKFETHVEQNARGFEELRMHMQTMAIATERQAAAFERQNDSMQRMQHTLEILAKSDSKIVALEEFRRSITLHTEDCDIDRDRLRTKLAEVNNAILHNRERVNRIYWVVPILATIGGATITAGWQVLTYFKVF
jgi:hypothetical protein